MFVKVLGREERSSDLLFRFYRWLRFRDLGDEAIASSLKQSIEQEALGSALAADDSIRAPAARGCRDRRGPAGLGVRARRGELAGRRAGRAARRRGPPGDLAPGRRPASGRDRRPDLRLANLMLDHGGQPWLIDFGFGTVAAPPQQLAGDVAELLCSIVVAVGPKRTVEAAVAELPPGQIQAALPRLQPDGLSTATGRP